MPFHSLTADTAAASLLQLGIAINPDQIGLERREERWLVGLADDRIAWFATSDAGRETLNHDRFVLRLIEDRCTFRAPRVLAEHPSGDFDVRSMVPGASDSFVLYTAASRDHEIANRLGTRIGEMLAELHTNILRSDVQRFIQPKPSWPESRSWILERLPSVVVDQPLIAKADQILSRCERVSVAEEDRVLIHGDLGLHALAYEPNTFEINGLFDFEGAAWADRHHDFRYLMLGNDRTLLDAALSSYEQATHLTLDRNRIYLYHAACALSYLAFRVGHPPEESWCGRTLNEDVEWTKNAMTAIE